MGKGSGKRWADPRDLPHAFKVLCPEELVSSLMGHGGRVKDQLQEETGARLVVSQRDEYFPGTHFRILTIFHEGSEGVFSALARIVDRVVECADRERTLAPTGGEADFLGKDPNSFVFRVAVSPKMAGSIIGSRGAKVKQIREEAKAVISINSDIQLDHQQLKVMATPDGITTALRRINECVQEESGRDTSAFQQWAFATFPRGGDAGPPPHWEREPERERERERSPRRQQRPPEGDPNKENIDGALGIIDRACMEFPPGTLDEEFVITCEMPKDKVSAMIGKHGVHIHV